MPDTGLLEKVVVGTCISTKLGGAIIMGDHALGRRALEYEKLGKIRGLADAHTKACSLAKQSCPNDSVLEAAFDELLLLAVRGNTSTAVVGYLSESGSFLYGTSERVVLCSGLETTSTEEVVTAWELKAQGQSSKLYLAAKDSLLPVLAYKQLKE